MELQKNIDTSVLLERIACWAVFASIQLLTANEVMGAIPYRFYGATSCGAELLSIIVLLRVRDSSLVRNLIDLSIYTLAYKLIFFLAYYYCFPAYTWMRVYIHPILFPWLVLVSFARLLFFPRPTAGLNLVDWPNIGPYGWLAPKKADRLEGVATLQLSPAVALVTFVILAELSLILSSLPTSWSFILTAAVGLEIVAFHIYPFDKAIRTSLAQKDSSIMHYEAMVVLAANTIEAMSKPQDQD